MPLFGSDGKKKALDAERRADVERLTALSFSELAVEVMVTGFGPDGPGAETMSSNRAGATVEDLAKACLPDGSKALLDNELRTEVFGLVAEGIQHLEHAGLVMLNLRAGGGVADFRYVPTRAGREALASGDTARQLRAGAEPH
jgi:hypothetical protein